MKFNDWINDVKTKGGIDRDGVYGKQCMDLYNDYCERVLDLTHVGADYAKNILNNPNLMNNVKRIDNYLEFVPQKGDIAVGDIGEYGHVAICLGEGNINYFKSIEQNWVPQTLTEQTHNYLDMGNLVFLRPNNQSNIVYEEPKTKFKIGDKVVFSSYYMASTDPFEKAYIPRKWLKGKITRINFGSRNPYLIDNGRCWINDGDIRGYAK